MSAETPVSNARPVEATSSWNVVASDVMREQVRSLIVWSVALAALAAMYIAFFPAMGGDSLQETVDQLPEGVINAFGYDDISSAAGYVNSTIYGLMGPMLLGVFVVMRASALVAGDEEQGLIELDVTSPISRRHLLSGRLIAVLADVTVLVAVLTGTTIAMVLALDLDIRIANVFAASVGLWLFVLAVGSVTAAVGAATGRRAHAAGAGAAVAVLSYILDALAPTADAAWMTALSPFSWYNRDNPLSTGVDGSGYVALTAAIVVACAVGIATYDRRDLMT